MNKMILTVGGTAVVSLAAGAFGGYLFAKRQLEDGFNQQMEEEIEATKRFYSAMHKKGVFETPESAVSELIPSGVNFKNDQETMQRIIQGLKYHPDVPGAISGDNDKLVEANIFAEVQEDLNVEVESVPEPNPDVPYIIARATFDDAEVGHRQLSLVYFEGDKVLIDEDEDVVEDIEKWVGVENMKHFGLQSGDKNVVYIRNEPMAVDFEVIRSIGNYRELVIGLVDKEE